MADAGRVVELKRTIRLTGTLSWMALRAEMQYRANLWMISPGLVFQGVGLAFIWVLLTRFDTMNGWSMAEMAFLYGIRLLAHGLWWFPMSRMFDLDLMIRTAEFDRFLIRPLNTLVQVCTSKVWLGYLGDIISGVAILSVAATMVDVDWSPLAVTYLGLAVLGGAFLEAGADLAVASFGFRFLNARSLVFAVHTLFSYGSYPMSIFGTVGQFAFTYLVPVAFMAYVPASVLLDRTDGLNVVPALAYLAPLVGLAVFALAYLLWRHELRHYQSAGN